MLQVLVPRRADQSVRGHSSGGLLQQVPGQGGRALRSHAREARRAAPLQPGVPAAAGLGLVAPCWHSCYPAGPRCNRGCHSPWLQAASSEQPEQHEFLGLDLVDIVQFDERGSSACSTPSSSVLPAERDLRAAGAGAGFLFFAAAEVAWAARPGRGRVRRRHRLNGPIKIIIIIIIVVIVVIVIIVIVIVIIIVIVIVIVYVQKQKR